MLRANSRNFAILYFLVVAPSYAEAAPPIPTQVPVPQSTTAPTPSATPVPSPEPSPTSTFLPDPPPRGGAGNVSDQVLDFSAGSWSGLSNGCGRVGIPPTGANVLRPIQALTNDQQPLTNVVWIAATAQDGFAVNGDGSAWSWGCRQGLLGLVR